jgi:hypothetical protein
MTAKASIIWRVARVNQPLAFALVCTVEGQIREIRLSELTDGPFQAASGSRIWSSTSSGGATLASRAQR